MQFQKFFLAMSVCVILSTGSEAFAAGTSDNPQSVAGGGVTAKVTFLAPKSNDNVRFQLVLDTHSVNLDTYDLQSIAVLRDDTGKRYAPVAVESKGEGHHREATLVFPKVATDAKRIELIIKDVAGIKERSFKWDLR